jgi:single-strand DNA-binding protein
MNICTFSGRVGRDPESRRTPSGDSVVAWPLAVDTGSRDKPATMWLDCSLWGKRGETLAQYISKGQKLTVSGRLSQDEYKANDGTTKAKLRLSVDQVELPQKGEFAEPDRAPKPAPKRLQELDDDLPF